MLGRKIGSTIAVTLVTLALVTGLNTTRPFVRVHVVEPHVVLAGASFKTPVGDFAPVWADSDSVYLIRRSQDAQGRLIIRRIHDGAEQAVVPSSYRVGDVWVLPDRSVLFTAVQSTGTVSRLYRLRDSGVERVLDWDFGRSTGLDPKLDGSEIVFNYGSKLYRYGFDSSHTAVALPIPSVMGAIEPRWSPEGEKVAFLAQYYPGSDFAFHLYVADTGLKNVWRLTTSVEEGVSLSKAPVDDAGSYEGVFAWSPDGTRIAYEHQSSPASEIWIADLTKKSTKRLVIGGFQPFWSKDGKSVYFLNERLDLSRVNLEDLAVKKVVQGIITDAAISPDGNHIAVTRKTGTLESKLELLRL